MIPCLHGDQSPMSMCFVPCGKLMGWVHTSLSRGCPGKNKFNNKFWWETWKWDVERYVNDQLICTYTWTLWQLPTDVLQRFPILQWPWPKILSLICLIHRVIPPYWPSLTTCSRPVPRSTDQATNSPWNCRDPFCKVFRLYGLPEDIISDHSVPFTSQFWQGFCKRFNINVCLFSAYHPQSNIKDTQSGNQEVLENLLPQPPTEQEQILSLGRICPEVQHSLLHRPHPLAVWGGYQPPLFLWSGDPSNMPGVDDRMRHGKHIWEVVRVHLQRTIQWQKGLADCINPCN